MNRAVAVLAVAIAAVAVVMLGGQALFGRLMASDGFGALPAAAQELLAILLVFGSLLGVALAGRRFAAADQPLLGPRPGRNLGLGLALGLGGLLLAALQAWLAGGMASGPGAAGLTVLVGVAAIACQAGAEEVYFRGWLQPVLARAWGPAVAVLVTALVFSLLHILGGARAPLTLVNLFLGGLWFGLLALRSGGIALPAGAHFGWNAVEQLGLGLDPNPGVGSFGALLDLDIAGAALWGGSAQGLNGSIGTTAVLAALILPLLALPQPFTRPALRG